MAIPRVSSPSQPRHTREGWGAEHSRLKSLLVAASRALQGSWGLAAGPRSCSELVRLHACCLHSLEPVPGALPGTGGLVGSPLGWPRKC